MGSVDDDQLPSPPAQTIEVCYRHPNVQTRVHCTRCERPICPDCMIPAPVGFQCPECVETARREFRQGAGRPFRGGVSVTQVLLALIVAVFVLEVVRSGPQALFNPNPVVLFDMGAMQPIAVAAGQFWRLFTAMFLHAGVLHLLFNGWALWLFGQQVERMFGRTWMLTIYLVSGFLATVASYAFGPANAIAVGASGAIFGIFGAFIAYNYRRRHLSLAAANLRMAMTLILLNLLLAFGFARIDWRAHLGGLIVGFLAGYAAEGAGSRAQRRLIQAFGFAGLIAAGIALTVWRTEQLRSVFGI
jgi:membrane associated rhomboid family serine protease